MPTFRYRAYGIRGELAEGSVEAASRQDASEALFLQGLTAFRLEATGEAAKPWWQREVLGGSRSSGSHVAAFTRELATLIGAEIPVDEALRILSGAAAPTHMRTLATGLLANVRNGASLSEAMRRQPQTFAADYVSIVRAGEVGGKVGQVLNELADLLERRLEIRGRMHSALVYPLLLVGMSLVTLAIVVTALVPSLASAFAESGRPLPAAVQFLVALQSRWLEVLIGVLATAATAACALMAALRRPGTALAFDRLKLKTPILGKIATGRETARLARTLGTLLRAGVPMLQALNAACEAVANRYIAAAMQGAAAMVREGARLHQALEREPALPPMALRMIAVGEEAGKLDHMLLRTAAMFEQQTERDIDRLMTLLTPLLTIIMAVLVGGLIVTVMTAILGINELAVQ